MHRVQTLALVAVFASTSLQAQDSPLQVLRHTPSNTASPGNIVTVTFDRPVAGRLESAIDVARIFRIEPAPRGRVEWRDPITIRFIPDEPLTPGSTFVVTIDTSFRAIDGSGLQTPYRFTFRVPGPRLLATSWGTYGPNARARLPVDGKFRMLYSAPVDIERLAQGLRLELTGCGAQTVRIASLQQRALVPEDHDKFRNAGGWDRDTTADRFRRVVDVEPALPLPLDCDGYIALSNTAADSIHGQEERYLVRTALPFQFLTFDCGHPDRPSCSLENLTIAFTAPVKRDDVKRYVRLEPAAQLIYQEHIDQAGSWAVKIRLAPRTKYTVIADSALRDIHGRRFAGPHRVQFATSDYVPSIGYPCGHITIPRSGPSTIPLRHVNARSVRIVTYRIPDYERSRTLSLGYWRIDRKLDEIKLRAETTLVSIAGKFNVEAKTQLPLPLSVTRSGSEVTALRIEIASVIAGPDSSAIIHGFRALRTDWYNSDFAFLQRTDLALHAKLAPGEGTVLVTSLADGRPRAGATVRHLGYDGEVLGEGVTGRDGVARLRLPVNAPIVAQPARTPIANGWPPRVGLIEAVLDTDRVFTPLSMRHLGYEPANALEPGSLGGRRGGAPVAAAAVFAERGIYRPGDMLYLKGVVRYGILGELAVPSARDSVRLKLTRQSVDWYPDEGDEYVIDPDALGDENGIVRDTVLRVSTFGTVSDSVRLRPGIQLGTYVATLQVAVRGEWQTVASERVRVAEYRAPEFLVEATTDSAVLLGGDTVRVQVGAKYLFGAAMGRAIVDWSATLREALPWEVQIPGAQGWTVGAWDWWTDGRNANRPTQLWGRDSLDAAGRAVIRVPVRSLDATRPGKVTVDVSVTDINRQVLGASASAQVHASDVYILARQKTSGWLWKTGERTTIEIRAVKPDGSALGGVPITVSLVRRHWRGSSDQAASPWTYEPVGTDTVLTESRPVSYSFVPGAAGAYDLRLSAPNGRDGVAGTTMSGYAIGGGGYAWWRSSPFHLPLVVEKRDHTVGENASVAFDSPFDSADAWVTIERERVLEHRRVVARRGSNVITLRLTERHLPNAFVSVMLMRRMAGAPRPDSAAELLRVGYAELRVRTSPKRLTVALEPARVELRPRDTAVVHVRVRDAGGRGARSEVTIWAVDAGVLALTGFETPDLLSRIYAPRGLGASLWSTMPHVLTSDPGLLVALARASVMHLESVVVGTSSSLVTPVSNGAPTLRSQFRPTAFYLASTVTDSLGRATVRARLPDNLTTFRLMAVAVGAGDRFGRGDTTLLVTRDIVARPTLPRFVRPSDTLLAGAAVNARDGRARPVSVDAAGDGIRLMGAASSQIALTAGKGAEARFHLAVPPRDSVRDTVTLRLRASDGKNGDAVETRLPVRPDFHARTHTLLGAIRDAADVVFDLPADIDPARSTLSLRLGTSPLAPMLAAYDWLRVYPYNCTEQISSGGRALVAVWRATRSRHPNALGGDPRPRLQELADEITRRQLPDGSIRYWDNHGWSTPWLSAYAGLFLLEARDAGVIVDEKILDRLSEHLTEFASSKPDTGGMNRFERRSRRLALGNRVAVVEYLRRAGVPAPKQEDMLLALTSQMTWEDRLRVAEVIASRGDTRNRAEALVDAAWRAVTPAGRRVDLPDSSHAEREFPSRVAPATRLLTATLKVRPEYPLLGGLVETVLQHGRAEGRWAWSTQDYASVVLALAALTDESGVTREVRVMAGNRTVLARSIEGAMPSATVPLTGLLERGKNGSLQLRLRLTSKERASKPWYFALSVAETPSRPPITPDIRGIVVERWYERVDNGKPVTTVQEGDLVRVRMRVTVPADRQYVAVEDPLPAGLEVVDMSLRTTGSLRPFVTPESERSERFGNRDRDGPRWQSWLYGRWDDGWWSPWEHKSLHDDRVVYFARMLWTGSYTASYIARATTPGTFVRPPAHAEEMYNPALQGRSDGGRFVIEPQRTQKANEEPD